MTNKGLNRLSAALDRITEWKPGKVVAYKFVSNSKKGTPSDKANNAILKMIEQ